MYVSVTEGLKLQCLVLNLLVQVRMDDRILQLQMAKLHLHQMKIQKEMESNILQAPMEPNGCVYLNKHH